MRKEGRKEGRERLRGLGCEGVKKGRRKESIFLFLLIESFDQ